MEYDFYHPWGGASFQVLLEAQLALQELARPLEVVQDLLLEMHVLQEVEVHSPVVAELAAVAVSILSAEASVAVAEERIPSAVGVAAALQAVEEVPVAAAVASS